VLIVFGIRLGLLAGAEEGHATTDGGKKLDSCLRISKSLSKLLFGEEVEHRRFKYYFFWRVPSSRLVKRCELQAYNDVSKDYRTTIFRVKQCLKFDFVYISIRALIFQNN